MFNLPLIIGVIAGILARGIRREKGKKLTTVGFLQALILTVVAIPFLIAGVKFLGVPTLGIAGMIAVFLVL